MPKGDPGLAVPSRIKSQPCWEPPGSPAFSEAQFPHLETALPAAVTVTRDAVLETLCTAGAGAGALRSSDELSVHSYFLPVLPKMWHWVCVCVQCHCGRLFLLVYFFLVISESITHRWTIN